MTAASGVRRYRWVRVLAARFCATQITQFGRCNDGRSGGQVAAHNGGSARVYLTFYRLISVPGIGGVHGTRTGVARILMQATPCPETLGHTAIRHFAGVDR